MGITAREASTKGSPIKRSDMATPLHALEAPPASTKGSPIKRSDDPPGR